MSKFQPRRFITNFVDGTAEFHDNDTPPAEEYLPLAEHNEILAESEGLKDHWRTQLEQAQAKLDSAREGLVAVCNKTDSDEILIIAERTLSKMRAEQPVPDTSTSIERDECGVETQDSWARRRSHHCKGGTRGIYCFDFHPSHEREKCDEARQQALAEKVSAAPCPIHGKAGCFCG